jgi:mannose-6-phosphate isomerase-like protein (cupin superfamily)
LENPVTGDRLEILNSPLHGEEGPLVFRCELPGNSKGSPLHRHDALQESFAVESGALTIGLGREGTRVLERGECLTIEPGGLHGFHNASTSTVVFEGVVTPGEGFEKFLRVMYGLAADGAVGPDGSPIDWRALALALGYGDIVLPAVPAKLQRAVLGALRQAGRKAGLERDFDAYFPQTDHLARAGAAS